MDTCRLLAWSRTEMFPGVWGKNKVCPIGRLGMSPSHVHQCGASSLLDEVLFVSANRFTKYYEHYPLAPSFCSFIFVRVCPLLFSNFAAWKVFVRWRFD